MITVNHLHAPWKLEPDHEEIFRDGGTVEIWDCHDATICQLAPFEDEWTVGEIARVKAIVATPDLLRMLKSVRIHTSDVQNIAGPLDAIIAKAEGRA